MSWTGGLYNTDIVLIKIEEMKEIKAMRYIIQKLGAFILICTEHSPFYKPS